MQIVLLAGFSFKTVLMILGFIILIYGICLGGGKSSSKDTTRYYDKKEEKPLIHAARTIDPNYTPKWSGYYKDKNGKVHREKSTVLPLIVRERI